MLARWRVVLLGLPALACGAATTSTPDPAGAGGMGGAGQSGDAACPASAPPVSVTDLPPGVGCYVGSGGVWVETPCSCQLWLRNPLPSAAKAAVSLVFEPADIVPSLTGSPDVTVAFEDADATRYATWAAQTGNGSTFSVAHAGSTTTVRLGAGSLTLSAVSLPACAKEMPTASVTGPWGSRLTLEMGAVLTDGTGTTVATSTGECFQPAQHSGFGASEGPEAGPADSDGGPRQ